MPEFNHHPDNPFHIIIDALVDLDLRICTGKADPWEQYVGSVTPDDPMESRDGYRLVLADTVAAARETIDGDRASQVLAAMRGVTVATEHVTRQTWDATDTDYKVGVPTYSSTKMLRNDNGATVLVPVVVVAEQPTDDAPARLTNEVLDQLLRALSVTYKFTVQEAAEFVVDRIAQVIEVEG